MTTIDQATPLQRKLYLEHKARLAKIYPPPSAPPPKPLSLARVMIVDHPEADGPVKLTILGSSMVTLLRDVARRHNFEPDTLRSKLRQLPVVHARNEFCYLAALKTQSPLAAIARFIRRDHATVLYAIGAHANRFDLPLPRSMRPTTYLSRLTRGKEEWQNRKAKRLSSAQYPSAG